jgi:hypothetical protein
MLYALLCVMDNSSMVPEASSQSSNNQSINNVKKDKEIRELHKQQHMSVK